MMQNVLCPKYQQITQTCLTFTATHYLPPYRPHLRPLDLVTFKEATSFVYGSIRPTSGLKPVLFYLHPFTPCVGPLDPSTCKEALLFIGYTSPLDPRQDFTTQKGRVANKNREKSNNCYFMIYNLI